MSTRIPISSDSSFKSIPNNDSKLNKTSAKGRKKLSQLNKDLKTKKIISKKENPISDLKDSLREECLRLASFLRQETHRPGYVR